MTTQSTTSDEPSSLWIVGAVVGPVAFVVIVIWIVVCIIYFKKKRAPNTKTLDSESDPPLLRMTSPAGEDGVIMIYFILFTLMLQKYHFSSELKLFCLSLKGDKSLLLFILFMLIDVLKCHSLIY